MTRLSPPLPSTSPPCPPDAVVFDLDGVLVDSEELWGVVEEQVVVGLGHAWDPAIRPLLHGKGSAEAAVALSEVLGADTNPSEIAARMAACSEELFAGGVPVNPGAFDLVKALYGHVPMAVATNSRRVLAEYALVGNGLDPWFETIVTADDVAAAKPAPDPYLRACERLGARPRRSVAIEDSVPGMTSAKAAGLWVIGYVVQGHASDIADYTVASFAELDLATFLPS